MKRKNTDESDDHQPQKYRSDIPDLNLDLTLSLSESPTCIINDNDSNINTNSIPPPSEPNPTTTTATVPSLSQQQPPRVRRAPPPPPRGRAAAKTRTGSPSARVHSMAYLQENGINTVQDSVKCKKCEKSFNICYNVQEKFEEIKSSIKTNKCNWHHRAPAEWTTPKLPTCRLCGAEDSCKPVIANNNNKDFENINWLFLLVSQLLGCCTLEQLKYFCEHNKLHRTGAKDRLIFLTYFKLCSQLDPTCPLFNLFKGG